MIALGLTTEEKAARVSAYVREHDVAGVVVLSPGRFPLPLCVPVPVEHVEWAEIIQYKFFYRLLQNIDRRTLVVINECLRTQKRSDLTYNCIRNFLNQTDHRIVFQYLPLIDSIEDFAILFDFDTRSRWKREPFDRLPLSEALIEVRPAAPDLSATHVPVDDPTRDTYAKKKRALIDGIGLRDPHTIPRNLYLLSGRAKLPHVAHDRQYVGRNNRFNLPNLTTYRDASDGENNRVAFELPHDFGTFSDFLAMSRQQQVEVLVADLKVDRWYFERYVAWTNRIRDAYAALR